MTLQRLLQQLRTLLLHRQLVRHLAAQVEGNRIPAHAIHIIAIDRLLLPGQPRDERRIESAGLRVRPRLLVMGKHHASVLIRIAPTAPHEMPVNPQALGDVAAHDRVHAYRIAWTRRTPAGVRIDLARRFIGPLLVRLCQIRRRIPECFREW